jgi:hypothetical protein
MVLGHGAELYKIGAYEIDKVFGLLKKGREKEVLGDGPDMMKLIYFYKHRVHLSD